VFGPGAGGHTHFSIFALTKKKSDKSTSLYMNKR
jgi:hypothetical protein